MEITFRWYGENDPVTLENIKQVPVLKGIVTSFFDIPIGDVIPYETIIDRKRKIEEHGLRFSVLESINVHEDIKSGKPTRDKWIANYCESIRNMGKAGIKILCYNFMPVFDWTRSDLNRELSDGSHALSYQAKELQSLNIEKLSKMDLPAWVPYSFDELKQWLALYQNISEETIWSNLAYFLKKVIPVAEEAGVVMAIHPDDPPVSVFGLPRIIRSFEALKRLTELVDSKANGITLCSGSLGPNKNVDLPKAIRYFGEKGRIHFGHVRNVNRLPSGEFDFHEAAHVSSSGSLDMYEIMKAYADINFQGPIRPDHGRKIWGETGLPGYGLFDRSLGAMYLAGLWEAIIKK